MNERLNELLKDEFCDYIESVKKNHEEKYRLLFYLLIETKEGSLETAQNFQREDNHVFVGNGLNASLQKLLVYLILKNYSIHMDNKNIKRLINL